MIPIRVAVEGFMSYKDRAVLDFEGAPLWMLSGPNGAGKSTIFDAITFALFGLHRGGKMNADELINQNSNGLVVEFDFAVGDDVYRAKRTYPRKGRASVQGFHVRGPNAPQPNRPGPQAVPETDQKSGFEDWIQNLVGLDDETFTASVLLQQGKSEVLLEANPAKRHEMLAQIVDLSSYQLLHQKADARRKELESEAKTLNTQIEGIEMVDDAEIERLGEEADAAGCDAKKLQDERTQIASWIARAEQWEKLKIEQAALETIIQAAGVLFAEAETIERNAAWLQELNKVLPQLQGLLSEREQRHGCREAIAEKEKQAKKWQDVLEQAGARLQDAEKERARLEDEEKSARERREQATQTRLNLAEPMQELNELARVQNEVQQFDQQLQNFAPDLDERLEELKDSAAAQRELSVALPWLEQWSQACDDWEAAKQKATSSSAKLDELKSQLEESSARMESLQPEREAAVHKVESYSREVTAARTMLGQIKDNLARFEQVDGQPSCSFCGQPLTADHLGAERARLEKERENYSREAQEAGARQSQAEADLKQLDEQLDRLRQSCQALERQKYEADCEQREARNDGRDIKARAENALSNLPQEWARRIQPDKAAPVTKCFHGEFPTQADLAELRQRVAAQQNLEEQLQALQEEAKRRESTLARRAPLSDRLGALEVKYPPEKSKALRTESEQAQRDIEDAANIIHNLQEPLKDSRAAAENATKAVQEACDQGAAAITDAKSEAARLSQIERGIESRLTELPVNWRAEIEPLADDELQTRLAAWRDEAGVLGDAAHKLEDLRAAQNQHKPRQDRLKVLETEIAAVPPEAQSSPAQLQQQADEVQQRAETAAGRERALRSEKQTLEESRQRRAELEESYNRAAHGAQLHKILSDLLGRDKLQRFLLQQAEAGIVSNANHVLDRISGGTLRLELRRTEEENTEESGRRRSGSTTQKALDLIAFNTTTGAKPLPVYLLSGSQRFRVAVSLALGIGQFASQSARRIESVIIDEGFGSLDQEGRREIIDELHNLKSVLKRIVLVSHQEEFADAFTNRYAIELKNGTSTASLVESG